jgi:hypothetical protein
MQEKKAGLGMAEGRTWQGLRGTEIEGAQRVSDEKSGQVMYP